MPQGPQPGARHRRDQEDGDGAPALIPADIDSEFGLRADPDYPGWLVRMGGSNGRFYDIFGTMRVRVEGEALVRIRLCPQPGHCNILGGVHGGFLAALADQALFVGPGALGIAGAVTGSTVDLSIQYLAPVEPGADLDVVIELLRETRRMLFARGLIEQGGRRCVAFAGTVRKGR